MNAWEAYEKLRKEGKLIARAEEGIEWAELYAVPDDCFNVIPLVVLVLYVDGRMEFYTRENMPVEELYNFISSFFLYNPNRINKDGWDGLDYYLLNLS